MIKLNSIFACELMSAVFGHVHNVSYFYLVKNYIAYVIITIHLHTGKIS